MDLTIPGSGIVWLGISDEAQEGHWVTPNNRPVSFTDWATGQPQGDRRENCVMTLNSEKWHDGGCNTGSLSFICEIGKDCSK